MIWASQQAGPPLDKRVSSVWVIHELDASFLSSSRHKSDTQQCFCSPEAYVGTYSDRSFFRRHYGASVERRLAFARRWCVRGWSDSQTQPLTAFLLADDEPEFEHDNPNPDVDVKQVRCNRLNCIGDDFINLSSRRLRSSCKLSLVNWILQR